MKTIYKYTLELTNRQTIQVPVGAETLHVGIQRGQICVWILIDLNPDVQDVEMGNKVFHIFGTGNPTTKELEDKRYIGTVQLDDYVWHIFEEELI